MVNSKFSYKIKRIIYLGLFFVFIIFYSFDVAAPGANLGDINGDKIVNVQDIILIESEFGKTFGFDQRADARKDGLIDLFDVMVVVINWGNRY